MPQVELFYDFRSPYSYLALTQLKTMDVQIALRPMQILKVMEKVGNVPTTITCKAKGVYARSDLGRWATRYRLTINPSDMRTNDGDACSRAVLACGDPETALTVTMVLYRAIWSEAKALTNPQEVVAEIAAAGLDVSGIRQRIDSTEIVAALDANTDEAAARGVFGSPTMFAGSEMFFGNDRIDFLKEHLAQLESAR